MATFSNVRPISLSMARSISRCISEPIGAAFDPLSLFAAGEQGAWYDPSDMSTLFQDAAGTTPVTAAGQPVGLMRDKSGKGNHATQATATSRPILQTSGGLWYLAFDGVDDSMQTSSINFTITNVITQFVGIKVIAFSGVILEFSPNITANNGAFAISDPTPPNSFSSRSRGTVIADATATGFTAPTIAVICGQGAIATDLSSVRVNGVLRTTNVSDQGTGNYGNYPLYIGGRAGVTAFFNGNLYGLIIRGVKSTDAEIAQTEAWMNSKTGAY